MCGFSNLESCTLSNGFQGTPIEGFPAFYLNLEIHVHVYCQSFNLEIGPPLTSWGGPKLSLTCACVKLNVQFWNSCVFSRFGDWNSMFQNGNAGFGDLDFKCFTPDQRFWRCGFLVDLIEMEIFGVWNSSVLLLICMRLLMFAVQKRC